MSRLATVGWRTALSVLAILVPGSLIAQDSGGTLTGRVIDASTRAPVVGAQVSVVGSSRGALADAEGRFVLAGVPAGAREVRIAHIGYGQSTRSVSVQAGETTTLDVELVSTALDIDGIVVSATGQQTLKREIGSKVGVIEVDDVELAPVRSMSDLLQSREAGVTVLNSGGTAGAGARIRIRGSNSLSLSNFPLIVIDGIRVNDSPDSFGIFTGGVRPSRLDDFNPEDIETIEILRGPSAAALYGTAAANGVIQVTTRRGVSGDAAWRMWAEGTAVDRNITMPDNFFAVDAAQSRCDLLLQSLGACTPAELLRGSPLEDPATTPFRSGGGRTFGASASGGGDATTWYVSGEMQEETGVQEENELSRVNLRGNVSGRVRDNLRITAGFGYVNYDAQFPQNDNSALGVLLNGLLGVPLEGANVGDDGYRWPKAWLQAWDSFQALQRTTLSATADWNPLHWLSVNATAGVDDVNQHDNSLVTPGVLTAFGPPLSIGLRESIRGHVVNYTATGSATGSARLTPELRSTTSLGAQYYRDRTQSIYASGAGLTPGTGSLGAATSQFDVDEANVENITLGAFLSQQFAWRERLFLNAAVRTDRNSAFGTNLGWIAYPSFSGSWVVSDESFFPTSDLFGGLRLRLAWGQSGLRPTFRQATQFFEGVSAANQSGEEPAFVISGAGNAALEPQRSTEWELGFEAALLHDRVGVDLTWYHKESENDIISRPLPPSAGSSGSRAENLGLMRNSGLELGIDWEALLRTDLGLAFRLTAARSSNELVSLAGQPAINFGLLNSTQRHEAGYPAGGYWQRPITGFADENGDGLIGPSEVEVGEDAVFLGGIFPEREVSLSTDLGIGSWLRVTGLLDYKGGHHQFNATEWGRCEGLGATCRARHDPSSSLEAQAAAVAWAVHGTVAGYVEEADFLKLREVAATIRIPDGLVRGLGGRTSLTLAGRNLFTWTDYSGFDPEVNASAQANFSTQDNTTLPPFRSFMLRFDVTF
ncbi:TonB-dependent receptor domain-containing protein [Gaopeijia maritima]|uniref:TonB-dependent receptor domain-containing protein n=1 Tax=Gaopeijia maritima TaxID=3119007 RepID=UPI00326A5DF7